MEDNAREKTIATRLFTRYYALLESTKPLNFETSNFFCVLENFYYYLGLV
jgi:hypothetical protein